MIEVETYMVDALATALETAFAATYPGLVVRRGRDVTGDGDTRQKFALPSITLMMGVPREDATNYILREETIDADTIRVIWHRANLEFPIDVWLYTESKEQRLEMMPTIRGLLYGYSSGGEPIDLEIQIPENYDATVRYFAERSTNRDQDSAEKGYATMFLRVRASSAYLDHRDHSPNTITVEED